MGLTIGQQQAAQNLAHIQSTGVSDWVPSGPSGTESAGISPQAWSDQNVVDMMNASEGTYTPAQIQAAAAKADERYRSGGDQAVGQANYDDQLKRANDAVKWWQENPNGHHMGVMDHIMGEIFPMVVMGAMGAGAFNAMGAAGAAAGEGGAAASGAGATAGGTAGGATGAGTSGLSGALSSTFGEYAPYVSKGLTSAGIKAGTNVISGKPLTQGVLQSGLMGGLGQYGSTIGGGYVNDGLSSLGMSPEMIREYAPSLTTGVLSTGASLAQGKGLGDSVKNGLQNGAISYTGSQLGDYIKGQGLGDSATGILTGAGKGAVGSVIKGQNPASGLLSGAAGGALGVGTGMLGSALSNGLSTSAPTTTENTMPDTSNDGSDWLSGLYSNLDDPIDFKNSTDFTNYGLPASGGSTIEDYLNPPVNDYLTPDYLGGTPAKDGDNADLAAWLKNQTSGSGDSSSSSSSFINNLLKQLGNVGTKASSNPLAALAALIGGAGTVRNIVNGPPSDLGKVDALMNQGATQMNTAPVQSRGQIAARDPRFFTQQYDANGQPKAAGSSAPAIGALTRFGG